MTNSSPAHWQPAENNNADFIPCALSWAASSESRTLKKQQTLRNPDVENERPNFARYIGMHRALQTLLENVPSYDISHLK
jgi:hypothetical protein